MASVNFMGGPGRDQRVIYSAGPGKIRVTGAGPDRPATSAESALYLRATR